MAAGKTEDGKKSKFWIFLALESGELRSVPGVEFICIHFHVNDVIYL